MTYLLTNNALIPLNKPLEIKEGFGNVTSYKVCYEDSVIREFPTRNQATAFIIEIANKLDSPKGFISLLN